MTTNNDNSFGTRGSNNKPNWTKKEEFNDIDWFGGDDDKFDEIIPTGVYVCSAIGETMKTSNNNPCLRITFTVEEGEYIGKLNFYNIVWTSRNKRIRTEDLKNLKISTREEINNFPADRIYEVYVIEDEYDGKQKNTVKEFRYLRQAEVTQTEVNKPQEELHPFAQELRDARAKGGDNESN